MGIKGKRAICVYDLLGGKCREAAAVYAMPMGETHRKWSIMS